MIIRAALAVALALGVFGVPLAAETILSCAPEDAR